MLVHVDMVRHSGDLVRGVMDALSGAETGDREVFDRGLDTVISALKRINQTMDSMSPRYGSMAVECG